MLIVAVMCLPLIACDQGNRVDFNKYEKSHTETTNVPTQSKTEETVVKPKTEEAVVLPPDVATVKPVPKNVPITTSSKVEFCKDKTLSFLISEMKNTDDCCLSKYLVSKYAVKDYKHSNQFKFQVCGATIQDCYYSKNDKYFVKNIPNVDKWGSFYFGLKWNKETSRLVNSLGQCESGYIPTKTSPDGGYGIFQITPAAIGDKNIKQSMLLTSEYNTQYGIFHLHSFWKNANNKYGKYNDKNNDQFIWYISLRGYNGGFKYIDRLFERSEDPLDQVFTGNYIESSKISGRFVCFEKVNLVYPLKIYKTSETLLKKSF